MTTKQTLQAIKAAGKKVSQSRLYIYLRDCGIRPAGANQRPQQYPPDTAARIIAHLGLSSGTPSKPFTPSADDVQRAAGLFSVKQLKALRPKKTTKGTK